jgi:hypothetical protein
LNRTAEEYGLVGAVLSILSKVKGALDELAATLHAFDLDV